MKRIAYLSIVLAVSVFVILGCASPQQRAQKLYDAGKYEEVVVKYSNEPTAAGVVQQSKDKIAERWLAEQRYQAVLDTFPNSPSAREARIRLAEQLLQQKRYQEAIQKYPETQAAAQARIELAKDTTANRSGVEQPGKGGMANKEAEATGELQRIMEIKVPNLRTKALTEFSKDPKWVGTSAQRQAQEELKK